MTNYVLIFFHVLFVSAASANAQGRITSFDVSNVSFVGRIDPSTKWYVAFIERPRLHLEIIEKNMNTSDVDILFQQRCPQSKLIITGGFFGVEDTPRLDGLHVSESTAHSPIQDWGTGGFLSFSERSGAQFTTLEDGFPAGSEMVLQSKPFLIENGDVAVNVVPDARWDRIAIGSAGYMGKSGVLIVAAISDENRRSAMRQHVFARAIANLSEKAQIDIDMMLNLDGAEGPFIFQRDAGLYLGSKNARYVPSIICLE